jgi:RpiB/LacA/LacB family sugar-phosphate isomerase
MQQPGNSTDRKNTVEDENIIYTGSDHAGYKLKEYVKTYLSRAGYNPVDMGNEKYEPGDDYPDFAEKVAKKVAETGGRGILICDSGVGVCIVANKEKGIRAVNATKPVIARMSREHNNTNVLCMGQNYIKPALAKKIIKVWLETEFSREERHHRRVDKIEKV